MDGTTLCLATGIYLCNYFMLTTWKLVSDSCDSVQNSVTIHTVFCEEHALFIYYILTNKNVNHLAVCIIAEHPAIDFEFGGKYAAVLTQMLISFKGVFLFVCLSAYHISLYKQLFKK